MASKTRSERRGEQTREDVLRVAESLMAARGYNATSMNDIIRESGVASSSIYWHFSSKAGVLAALMERGAVAFFDSIDEAPPAADDDPQAALELVIRRGLDAVKRNPDFLSIYLAFLLQPEDEPAVQKQVEAVRRAARETVRTNLRANYASFGPARAARVADRVAPLAIAFFDGMFIAMQSSDEPNLKRMVKDVADALHHVACGVR